MDVKQIAAKAAVSFIQNGTAVGLGAGSTMAYMAEYLKESKPDILLFSSAAATRHLLSNYGFKVNDIATVSQLDIYFDGCDQFDKHLNALKSGGGIHTAEKLYASMATEFVLVGDESKYSDQLTTQYPVVLEILPQAIGYVPFRIQQLFGNASNSFP